MSQGGVPMHTLLFGKVDSARAELQVPFLPLHPSPYRKLGRVVPDITLLPRNRLITFEADCSIAAILHTVFLKAVLILLIAFHCIAAALLLYSRLKR